MRSQGMAAQPRFAVNSWGSEVVVWEPAELPLARAVFVGVTLAIGLAATLHAALVLRRVLAPGPRSLVALYMVNVWLHTWHYADNIVRPVAYHEPGWLYRRLLLAPMDRTFMFNMPMTLLGSLGAEFVRAGNLARCLPCFVAYAVLSLVAFGHFAVAPVSAYAPSVVLSIAGESLGAAALAALCRRLAHAPLPKQ